MKKLWSIWLIILLAVILSFFYLNEHSKAFKLPLPDDIMSISINNQGEKIHFEKKDGYWYLGTQINTKIENLIALLSQSCSEYYEATDIQSDVFSDRPIELVINRNHYLFGDFHRLQNSYVKYGDKIWLCNQQIKARSLQNLDYWKS